MQPGQQYGQQYAPGAQVPSGPMQYAPQAPVNAPVNQPVNVPMPTPVTLGFQDPSRGGGVAPAARHLMGRTVMLIPKSVDESATYGAEKQSRPTAYFDLYVVDGGEIVYGDSEERGATRPPTHKCQTPAFFPYAMSGNVAIVNEIKSKLGPDGQATGIALGVMDQSPNGRHPYVLTKCEIDARGQDRPDGQARRDNAQKLYFAHTSGGWTPPVPVPLAQAAPPAGQGVVNYQQPPQQYANYAPPQPAMAPQYAQQAPQAAPLTASYPTAPPAQAGQQYPPAPGWEGNPAWSQFAPEQQAQIWAQVQQSNAQQSAPPAATHAPNGQSAPANAGQGQPPATAGPMPAGPGW
jgi:hypothetical protein